MALGMPRIKVILLFTYEGVLNGILGIIAATVIGIPVLVLFASKGIPMPQYASDFGFSIPRLYPVYSAGLVITTVIIIMCAVTIVSYMPSRKISGMKPTDALRGKTT
jgi:ABC-type lipoprotein release transport system permease subunit